ncbi:MAG TPA: ABC transporter permease [Chloroflexota bacterium]|nr:ABC transporter permease [Chloroflexota bacterium]
MTDLPPVTVDSTAAPAPPPSLDLDAGELAPRRPRLWQRFARHRLAMASLCVIAALAVIAIIAPLITPYDPYAQNFDPTLLPSGAHWLGTDELGRDELSRVILGARISLSISFGATVVALVVGLLIGTTAGYLGGLVDNLLMRLVDLVLAFPALFLILIVAVTLGVGVVTIIFLIGFFNWMYLARLSRAEFLQIRELEYIQAARAVGAPTGRIIWRHILPNAMGPIIVSSTFILAAALYIEAVLDFLGFGISPDIPSWGNLLTTAQDTFADAPQLAIVPGVLLTLAILCMNFIGDGLRDAIDPRHVR